MDSSSSLFSSLCRKRKAVEKLSMTDVSKRDRFFSTYRRQNFALPDSIMYYIAMNPATPKVYQSMAKTCKFFFVKNPIIVLSDAYWERNKWQGYINGRYEYVINYTKFPLKLWINGRFSVSADTVSNIIPRIYRFDANELRLYNQNISYNEYVCLSSSPGDIFFYNVIIKDENGSILDLEKIVEIAAKAKRFTFRSVPALTNITSKTAKEIFGNPNFSRLKYFSLYLIPETFDLDAFYEYMKKNKTTSFYFIFDTTISDGYKARLDAIIDEILGTETFDYKPPFISFFGMHGEKNRKLYSIFADR